MSRFTSLRVGLLSCPCPRLPVEQLPISPHAPHSRRFSLRIMDPEDPLSMCMTRRRLSLSGGSFSWLVSLRLRARSLLLTPAACSGPWTRRDFGPRGLHDGAGASRPLPRALRTLALLEHLGWVALLPTGCDWMLSPGPTDRLYFSVAEFLTWVCGSF